AGVARRPGRGDGRRGEGAPVREHRGEHLLAARGHGALRRPGAARGAPPLVRGGARGARRGGGARGRGDPPAGGGLLRAPPPPAPPLRLPRGGGAPPGGGTGGDGARTRLRGERRGMAAPLLGRPGRGDGGGAAAHRPLPAAYHARGSTRLTGAEARKK